MKAELLRQGYGTTGGKTKPRCLGWKGYFVLVMAVLLWSTGGRAEDGNRLQVAVNEAVQAVLKEFGQCKVPTHAHSLDCKLHSDQVAVTAIQLGEGTNHWWAHYRGTTSIFPVQRKGVSPARSEQMLELLRRDFTKKGDQQATEFIGKGLPASAKLWSKAGWTSTVRHDAAYVELPDGRRMVLVVFTTGHSEEREIIPALARRILVGLANELR